MGKNDQEIVEGLRRARGREEIERALKPFGFNKSELALRSGTLELDSPEAYQKKLRDLVEIVLLFCGEFTPEVVGIWFHSYNYSLGSRPIDVVAFGDSDAVRRAVQGFIEGSYI